MFLLLYKMYIRYNRSYIKVSVDISFRNYIKKVLLILYMIVINMITY